MQRVSTSFTAAECNIDAQSVAYQAVPPVQSRSDLPELSGLSEAYRDWSPQEVRQALDGIQDMSKKIGGSIEQANPHRSSIRAMHRNAALMRDDSNLAAL